MTRRSLLAGTAGLALAPQPENAPMVRSLGQPCRSRNVLAGRLVRVGGRDLFVLTNMNEAANMELVCIDVAAGTAEVVRAPAGSGSWALNHLGDGKMVVGTYYDGTWMLYDLKRKAWVGTGKFPGEDYLWNFAIGRDRRVYAGTYPGGKLGAFDPLTLTVEDCGAPTKDAGNQYLRYVSALPDGRMFCYFGMAKAAMWIWDPEKKTWAEAPETMRDTTWGVSWRGHFVAGQTAFTMPDGARAATLPFPKPPADGWNVDVPLSTPNRLVLRAGQRLWMCRPDDTALTALPDAPYPTGNVYAVGDDGTLYGVRGQDWFVAAPGKPAVLRAIPGEAGPRPTHFLEADDRGRVWGGPTFGQTLFHVDAATGKTVNTRTVSDHGGEVYDVAVVDGVCYAAAYAGGEVIRFDPDAAWDQIGHVNPRTLATVAPDYIRPTGGIVALPGNRLASGWMAKYGAFGGAVAITELPSGKTTLHRDPLGPWPVEALCAAGSLLFLATGNGANGLPSKEGAPTQLGLLDPADGKILWRGEIPGVAAARNPVFDPARNAVWFVAGGLLRRFDLAARTLAPVGDAPKVGGAGLVLRRGRLVSADGATLRFHDPDTGKGGELAVLPAKIGRLAAGPRGLYAACGVDLYEITEETG